MINSIRRIKNFFLGEEILKRYRKQEGYVEEIPVQRPSNEFQRKIWEVFECPESSNSARVVAIISIVMIVVSIATFIIETLPVIRNELLIVEDNKTHPFQSLSTSNESGMYWVFFYIETVCVVWFTFEFVCRFLVAPSKFAFIKNGPNIIDVVSIIPYFIQLIGLIYQTKDSNVSGFSSTLTVLRIVRLVRVFRIFKLSRHFKVRLGLLFSYVLLTILGSPSACFNIFSIMERITSLNVFSLYYCCCFFVIYLFC